jgi:hypothetical protein
MNGLPRERIDSTELLIHWIARRTLDVSGTATAGGFRSARRETYPCVTPFSLPLRELDGLYAQSAIISRRDDVFVIRR